jgi:hypothetical protein
VWISFPVTNGLFEREDFPQQEVRDLKKISLFFIDHDLFKDQDSLADAGFGPAAELFYGQTLLKNFQAQQRVVNQAGYSRLIILQFGCITYYFFHSPS